ncbi:MAG: hypothetical protein JXQ71_13860 [Verrucomicrobia bacterium]|nr:hypothetical protein [Verrucomicrobiota bacterium]
MTRDTPTPRVLAWLCSGEAKARTVGRRAIALNFLLNEYATTTQRELAARLGVSEARVSQLLREIHRAI